MNSDQGSIVEMSNLDAPANRTRWRSENCCHVREHGSPSPHLPSTFRGAQAERFISDHAKVKHPQSQKSAVPGSAPIGQRRERNRERRCSGWKCSKRAQVAINYRDKTTINFCAHAHKHQLRWPRGLGAILRWCRGRN